MEERRRRWREEDERERERGVTYTLTHARTLPYKACRQKKKKEEEEEEVLHIPVSLSLLPSILERSRPDERRPNLKDAMTKCRK